MGFLHNKVTWFTNLNQVVSLVIISDEEIKKRHHRRESSLVNYLRKVTVQSPRLFERKSRASTRPGSERDNRNFTELLVYDLIELEDRDLQLPAT